MLCAAMTFSIIIPTFNASSFMLSCLESLATLDVSSADYEVILVDDCSTDDTVAIARGFQSRLPQLKIVELEVNGGPGHARNHGIASAGGDWVLFLDSDDELSANALVELQKHIVAKGEDVVDAVGYNWSRIDESSNLAGSQRVGRRDGAVLLDRDQMLKEYLMHRMDGSVIFTAMRRDMLLLHDLRFACGIHEDVDFIFRVYFHARSVTFLDRVLYRKRNHADSIIHNISERHIDGYFRAWQEIGAFLSAARMDEEKRAEWLGYHQQGSCGAVATRVREIVRHSRQAEEVPHLFQAVYHRARNLLRAGMMPAAINGHTLYKTITKSFMKTMEEEGLSLAEKAGQISDNIKSLEGKSWSCVDLHHSVFLRGSQVRTCCKRFFVEGEMRGDVVLFDVAPGEEVTPDAILESKRELHQKLNSGVSCDCDGCPFLEFKNWGPLNSLDVRYLSLEHHSVCNLECNYCSDEYYGGKQAQYNVAGTVDQMIDNGALEKCSVVVWGGGEPTIGKDFDYILGRLLEKLPAAQQRVLSNSVKKSASVCDLLEGYNAQLVTSIDAGSDDTFAAIRGRRRMKEVLGNLKAYSDVNARKVTIKYIFTQGNDTLSEVQGFVSRMTEADLLKCNFQISGNFKNEYISTETAKAMVAMFGLLRKAGAQVVYFDDLLRHRLGEVINPANSQQVKEIHDEVGFDFIATPERYPEVVIWGAGQQAKYFVSQCAFFKQSRLVHFVDETPSKIGTLYENIPIQDPSSLTSSDYPVIIAAVQSYPIILERYRKLGLPESRLISDLVV